MNITKCPTLSVANKTSLIIDELPIRMNERRSLGLNHFTVRDLCINQW